MPASPIRADASIVTPSYSTSTVGTSTPAAASFPATGYNLGKEGRRIHQNQVWGVHQGFVRPLSRCLGKELFHRAELLPFKCLLVIAVTLTCRDVMTGRVSSWYMESGGL